MSVLFVCASPRGRQSSSLWFSEYVEAALPAGTDVDRILLGDLGLEEDDPESDLRFEDLVGRMQSARVVVWVLGLYTFGVPSGMRLLLDRLLATTVPTDFAGRGVVALLTSAQFQDDRVLDRVRLMSEQLGFGWIGDASVLGNPVTGFERGRAVVLQAKRIAGEIADVVQGAPVPPARSLPIDRQVLAPGPDRGPGRSDPPWEPASSGPDLSMMPAGPSPILVLTGTSPDADPAVAETIDAIRDAATRPVEVADLARVRLRHCTGCYACNREVAGRCVQPDALQAIRGRMARAGAVVVVSRAGAAMPDLALRRLAERMWGDCHRPPFTGIPGAVAVVRGGPVADLAGDDLALFLSLTGIRVVGRWTDAPPDPQVRRQAVALEIRRLERAMDEGVDESDRYSVTASRLAFRDMALRWSFFLRADYRYHRVNGLLQDRSRWRHFGFRLLAHSQRFFRAMLDGGRRKGELRHAHRLDVLRRERGQA